MSRSRPRFRNNKEKPRERTTEIVALGINCYRNLKIPCTTKKGENYRNCGFGNQLVPKSENTMYY